jgi:hypothetical protein
MLTFIGYQKIIVKKCRVDIWVSAVDATNLDTIFHIITFYEAKIK